MKPGTVIYKHKKPDDLDFCSLKLRFLWGTDPIYFYPGDLVTHTGDWKIRSVSSRPPDNAGELAYVQVKCTK